MSVEGGNMSLSTFPLGLECWWLFPLAFGLDMAVGDPRLPWRHPVCWVGWLLNRLEIVGRRLGASRPVGALCLIVLMLATGAAVWALTALPVLGVVGALYLAYAGLASQSLLHTFEEVLEAVEHKPLPEAQAALSMLVSRDTSVLDRPLLRKSLADTLTENLTDAVVAPMFWLLLAGPVGLWMYKAVSTTDSMWGYKTERWLTLGWAGARLDDVLAYVPARLGVFFLWMANRISATAERFGGRWPGWVVIARQAGGMESPNSGWPMAAGAWLLGARMGGPTLYFGSMVEKPWVGLPEEEAAPWNEQRLRALGRAVRLAAWLGAACMYVCALALYGWWN